MTGAGVTQHVIPPAQRRHVPFPFPFLLPRSDRVRVPYAASNQPLLLSFVPGAQLLLKASAPSLLILVRWACSPLPPSVLGWPLEHRLHSEELPFPLATIPSDHMQDIETINAQAMSPESFSNPSAEISTQPSWIPLPDNPVASVGAAFLGKPTLMVTSAMDQAGPHEDGLLTNTNHSRTHNRNRSSVDGTKYKDGQWTPENERIVLGPYDYMLQHPGKDIRRQLINAFDVWLKVPQESLEIITKVVAMLHTASLL